MKKQFSMLLALMVFGFSITACDQPLSDEDVEAIRKSAEEDWVELALAGRWAEAAAMHIEDAVRMPPNEPLVEGRTAIEASLRRYTITALTQTAEQIEGRNGLAYARGTYSGTLTLAGMPEPITDTGKWLGVFQKQADGVWLVSTFSWNSDQPLPNSDLMGDAPSTPTAAEQHP